MNSPCEQDAKFAREQLAIGCETMERMLDGLLNSKGRIAEEVHAIRKHGKSLRGGFALFGMRKGAAREIQAIGRLLSEPRDAVSRLNTWRKLAWEGDASAAIFGLLEQQTHSAARRPPVETVEWCVARVIEADKELMELPTADLAERAALGLNKLSKQLAKRCRRLDHRGEEDFHDARKALKAYLGAIGYLPEGFAPPDPKMTELAELLGDENDLGTLSAWIEKHGFTEQFEPDLWVRLNETRLKLRKKAIRDAAQMVFAS
jgi:hypothetical protein